jgi:hypothetical protein
LPNAAEWNVMENPPWPVKWRGVLWSRDSMKYTRRRHRLLLGSAPTGRLKKKLRIVSRYVGVVTPATAGGDAPGRHKLCWASNSPPPLILSQTHTTTQSPIWSQKIFSLFSIFVQHFKVKINKRKEIYIRLCLSIYYLCHLTSELSLQINAVTWRPVKKKKRKFHENGGTKT